MKTPDDVRANLWRSEWRNHRTFRDRVLGLRNALEINLQAPESAHEAIAKLTEVQRFARGWREAAPSLPTDSLRWKQWQKGPLAGVHVPTHLILNSTAELASFLGGDARDRLRRLVDIFKHFEAIDPKLASSARRHFSELEALRPTELEFLIRVMEQIRPGLGNGLHLREVPFTGVDTKFSERNISLISNLADGWFEGEVAKMGGLLPWLGCRTKGSDQLLVLPLCDLTRSGLGGLRSLWVTSFDLAASSLPGDAILVIENDVPARDLPNLPGVVVIAGVGNNIAWLSSPWVKSKKVGFWGDIDSWGMAILARARRNAPHLTALMMDRSTLELHRAHVVTEPKSCDVMLEHLLEHERGLVSHLAEGGSQGLRLEQEFLGRAFVTAALTNWNSSPPKPAEGFS